MYNPECPGCRQARSDIAYADKAYAAREAVTVEQQQTMDSMNLQNHDLLEVIDSLRHFIGDTFYANVPSDEKPLPNSWYKGTNKTYGAVLDAIMARVPAIIEKPNDEVEEREPNENKPIGKCPKCGRDVYTVEGFCGGCRPF